MASATKVRSKQRAVIEFPLAEHQGLTDIRRRFLKGAFLKSTQAWQWTNLWSPVEPWNTAAANSLAHSLATAAMSVLLVTLLKELVM
ncbi:hypothetical protein C0J52_24130 [Blattella germanica]|nr:hypothetical protein C0J52_24130 [Blattella germanica]